MSIKSAIETLEKELEYFEIALEFAGNVLGVDKAEVKEKIQEHKKAIELLQFYDALFVAKDKCHGMKVALIGGRGKPLVSDHPIVIVDDRIMLAQDENPTPTDQIKEQTHFPKFPEAPIELVIKNIEPAYEREDWEEKPDHPAPKNILRKAQQFPKCHHLRQPQRNIRQSKQKWNKEEQ